MAVQKTIDPVIEITERTEAIYIGAPAEGDHYSRFFRQEKKVFESGRVLTTSVNEVVVLRSQMAEVLQHVVVPDQYKTLFPTPKAVGLAATQLPALLEMMGDALNEWQAAREAERLAQQLAAEEAQRVQAEADLAEARRLEAEAVQAEEPVS